MAIGGVLFDIDGVLVTSWRPDTWCVKNPADIVDHQVCVLASANTTTRTRVQIAELLTEAGMAVRRRLGHHGAVLTRSMFRSRYPHAPGASW